MELSKLRQQYPRFVYDSFQTEIAPEGLKLTFFFTIEPDIKFQPTITIQGVTPALWQALPENLRRAWVFHLGLAEIPSYWKATASPEIIVKAGHLSPKQIAWWHKLLVRGMGEYFYLNQIDFTAENFVNWTTALEKIDLNKVRYPTLEEKYLVPVGGGKDSALTTCLLNQQQLSFDIFLLNPTKAMEQVARLARPEQIITASRQIDPKLLALNQQGYLNGHVPFSANIAFLARLIGLIFGHQNVVISNERSSNEGNVWFLGREINHQYSKSFEFEQDLEQYLTQHHLVPKQAHPSYFSLLRPLYELQISRLFTLCTHFAQLAPIFRSCNRGKKTNSWCGECPKCLFTFASFYPFVTEEKLVTIFGQNLFEKESLLPKALALLGKTTFKPFECVGTHEESIVAFYLSIKKLQTANKPLPILLQLVLDQMLRHQSNLPKRSTHILSSWNTNHQLPAKLEKALNNAITSA
ncbi:hypothetical protein KJ707_03190 [Patescibacteria group bacterium]|nr:hypothetical protein [Patescibacteria group bacterium]